MRVLVCGGHTYADKTAVFQALDRLHASDPIECVIHGNAPGADRFADHWAGSRRVRVERYDADWMMHGRMAGPMRNRRMLAEGKPDLVVAFPGARGTAHMVKLAREAGVRVIEGEHA